MEATYESGRYTRVAAARAARWVWFTAAVGPPLVTGSSLTFQLDATAPLAAVGALALGKGLLALLVGLVGAGVATIIWLTRARDVCDDYYPFRHQLAADQTVQSWLWPVSQYYRPFVVVADVVAATEQAGPGRGPLRARLRVWWFAWLTALPLVALGVVAQAFLGSRGAVLAQAAAFVLVSLPGVALYLTAAHILTTTMTAVARWQDEDIQARHRAATAPPVDDAVWQRPSS